MSFLESLTDALSTYYNATGINTVLLDRDGVTIRTFGESAAFCRLFHEATGRDCPCSRVHQQSCLQAVSLGEGYIYSCPAGLIHFSVAVMKKDKHIASILAGPVSFEVPEAGLIDAAMEKNRIAPDLREPFYEALAGIPVVETYRARYLCKLLFLIANSISGEHAGHDLRSAKNLQQARIGESIHSLKQNPNSVSQFRQEKQLISDVLVGDAESAKALLNEMLGRIYFDSGNDFERIKIRSVELLTVLSRALIDSGEDPDTVFRMSSQYLESTAKVSNLTDLSFSLLETLEKYTALAFPNVTENNLTLIRKSIHYINQRYNTNLTLDEVSAVAGLSPTSFSILFKKETGFNFLHYLNNLRVDKANYLLRNSSLTLSAIAEKTGFESQSYFTKVFKKQTGSTPRQYRESL